METPKTGAFAVLAVKTAEAGNTDKAHRVYPKATTKGDTILVELKIADVGGSKPSKGEKGVLGFMLEAIPFEHDGQQYEIKPGWCTLRAKR